MKKLLSIATATAVATLGFVAVSGTPAEAACTPTKYQGCINTTTTVVAPGKVKRGRSVPISVSVAAPGTVTPSGTVTVTVSRSGGGVYQSTQGYFGGNLTFVTQGLYKKGTYVVTAVYNSSANSIFNGSSAATSFHVKKKKHRHH